MNSMSECLQKRRLLWFKYLEIMEVPGLVYVESSRLILV